MTELLPGFDLSRIPPGPIDEGSPAIDPERTEEPAHLVDIDSPPLGKPLTSAYDQ